MDNFWKNKKVLVTGGTGFLGRYLVQTLAELGAIVYVIDFRPPNWQIKDFTFEQVDIRDKEKIYQTCKDKEFVFHLAAIPSIARAKSSTYQEINVFGTRNILESAYSHKVEKLAYVSSSTVYGIPREFPLKEASPVHPLGKYGRSKLEAENACRSFIEKGLSISIIRPRVIIGSGRIGIFSILFDRIYAGKPVYIIGKGDNVFQFTNVLDMVSACIKAAEYPRPDIFNIGSEEVRPVREEIQALLDHAKSKSLIISVWPPLARLALSSLSFLGISPLVNEQFSIADKNFKLDTHYAREILGWSPKHSNVDSLIQAYDWYIENVKKVSCGQYRSIFGVLGKFKHSHMGGFQK